MSEYEGIRRRRGRNLLIVEGNHEKNKLFRLLFRCFPELNINMDDVWVYGTNIYMLYEDIVREYGSDWADEGTDIDLPFIISRNNRLEETRYKADFVNIILVFDYERHDPNFSERKILEMQRYFSDAADMGRLYINYPMIESYLHLEGLPDPEYYDRKVSVTLQPGSKYKELVAQETCLRWSMDFPNRLEDLLEEHYGICDEAKRRECMETIFSIVSEESAGEVIQEALSELVEENKIQTVTKHLLDWMLRSGYIRQGESYWQYMRNVFCQIIKHNVYKADRIQNDRYMNDASRLKELFESLDFVGILCVQNACSDDRSNGFIWVLNTCIFFIAEYNFALVG